MSTGIVGYGAYVPFFRLPRARIVEALGVMAGPGERAVASYDEDTTSLGVEAARVALRSMADPAVGSLFFATAAPGYLDKTNATAIHAALGLDPSVSAYDMVGSVRSGVGALRAALGAGTPAMAVLSDVRTGLAGGADESGGGDAAVALVCGPGTHDAPQLAELVGAASATGEFLDRWRVPGRDASEVWEERFSEHAYRPLVERAITDACKDAGVTAADVDHLVVAGPSARANRSALRAVGAPAEALTDDLGATVGNTGTAHPGLLLASVLDHSGPGQLVALVVVADGADVLMFRTTDALATRRPSPSVAEQVASGRNDLGYDTFLTWRGFLVREPPRRPDPQKPASPPALRSEEWKFAFTGTRCRACGARNLPPQRVCVNCHAVDEMDPEHLADVPATIATFTVDRLAPSLNPPIVVGVLDFDGGGRYQCELTDLDPSQVAIGMRVEMTFRRIATVDGVHNYFWKARPLRERAGEETG